MNATMSSAGIWDRVLTLPREPNLVIGHHQQAQLQSATESMTTDEETDDYLADYQLKSTTKVKVAVKWGQGAFRRTTSL